MCFQSIFFGILIFLVAFCTAKKVIPLLTNRGPASLAVGATVRAHLYSYGLYDYDLYSSDLYSYDPT